MRLTDRTDFALRVLLVLSASDERRTVRSLADGLRVSQHHLAKVVQAMHDLEWVRATPGRGGGVELSCDPARLSVGTVVAGLEPDFDLAQCHREAGMCPLDAGCPLRSALDEAKRAFLDSLDSVTIAQLIHQRTREVIGMTVGAS